MGDSLFEWGIATWTMEGETESGDVAVVTSFADGALAAAIDGLGHGPEAARAANLAAQIVRRFAGEPIDRLVKRAHQALRQTRGAVMTIASFRPADHSMTWLGVGNVEATLFPAADREGGSRRFMVLSNGIVGYRLPALRPTVVRVEVGDTLILTTDGVDGELAGLAEADAPPTELAQRILDQGGKRTDDALVLAVRYVGQDP